MVEINIIPQSRQMMYLMKSQVALRGGKFIQETAGGITDSEVPSDIVNMPPPRDGQIASAGNPFAFKLDGPRDEYGNEWQANMVKNGDAVPFSVQLGSPVKVRRVICYITEANWNNMQPLSRASFDLANPLLHRTYACAPYHSCDDPIPNGLVAIQPLKFNINLPQRTAGHHVLLLEIDYPDTGDATYQVIDLRFTY